MQRSLAGLLITVFLYATAAVTHAAHVEKPAETSAVIANSNVQITLDGSVRARGYLQQDTTPHISGERDDDKGGYDGRIRFGAKAKVNEEVAAYIRLETGDASSDNYSWGEENASALNTGGTKDDNDLSVLEGWLQYTPGCVGVKVGHMPLALGNKLFYDHTGSGDDAILVFGDLSPRTHLSGAIIKLDEGFLDDDDDKVEDLFGSTDDNTNDLDMYFLTVNQKLNDQTLIGADLSFLDHDDLGLRFWNLGVNGTIDLGALDLGADLEYQFGDLADNENDGQIDQSAFALQLNATMDLGNFKVGGLFGYGSGDDNPDDTENENFVNFLTDTGYQVIIPGYRLKVPGQATKNTGLANLMLWQLHASTATKCPLTGKDLGLSGRVSKITLNEDVAGEDDLGVEVAAFATWKLTSGLKYKIEAVYLFSGDAWDPALKDPDDAYFLRHGIELTF